MLADDESKLKEKLAQAQEDLFLCQQDVERYRTEGIAFKNFLQTLYENCEQLEKSEDDQLSLKEVLKNLKQNISTFGRAHRIRF